MTLPTTERIAEILAGATKGRRVQFHPKFCKEAEGTPPSEWDTSHDTSLIREDGSRHRGYSTHKHSGDALLDNMAYDLAERHITNTARITALEGFIRDFAACKFDALPHPFTADPQDRPDDVTELLAVWAWQDDARDLLKGGE